MGVPEDLIAIAVTTEVEITPEMIGVVVAVSLPFAVLSELVVDQYRRGEIEVGYRLVRPLFGCLDVAAELSLGRREICGDAMKYLVRRLDDFSLLVLL